MPVDLVVEDVIKIIKIPCTKDCPERSATCHATCGKYKTYREAIDEKNKIIHKYKEERAKMDDRVYKTAVRAKKEKRYKVDEL